MFLKLYTSENSLQFSVISEGNFYFMWFSCYRLLSYCRNDIKHYFKLHLLRILQHNAYTCLTIIFPAFCWSLSLSIYISITNYTLPRRRTCATDVIPYLEVLLILLSTLGTAYISLYLCVSCMFRRGSMSLSFSSLSFSALISSLPPFVFG
jgi:hypothetical protein